MTPASQFDHGILLDRSNGWATVSSTSTTPSQSTLSTLNPADRMSGQDHLMHAKPESSFSSVEAYLGATVSTGDSYHIDAKSHNVYTHSSKDIGVGDTVGSNPQARARAVPSHPAARFATRSHTVSVPLATIIEQGSYSTLDSRGSFLCEGRFPSDKICENASPSLHDKLLHRTQEDGLNESKFCTVAESKAKLPGQRADNKCMPDDLVIRLGICSPESRSNITERGTNSKISSETLRGVLQSVPAGSRTRSQASPLTHACAVTSREQWAGTSENCPQSDSQATVPAPTTNEILSGAPCSVPNSSSRPKNTNRPENEFRNRQISIANPGLSTPNSSPLLDLLSPTSDTSAEFGFVPHLLPPSVATCLREQSPPVHRVHSEARDEVLDRTTTVSTLPTGKSKQDAAQHAFYGVFGSSPNVASLTEPDCARESGRNASFCSTLSTSYSGTVLGVDVDLQHEFVYPARRSRSPPSGLFPPVWFTPQMMELERQASVSESLNSELRVAKTIGLSRTVYSGALTSLLPIAAASGIVRPDFNKPRISFYSPSGNIIQPEESIASSTSSPDLVGSFTTTTSYYTKNAASKHNCLPATTCLPPTLIHATPPLPTSAPLPLRLRQHKDCRLAGMSKRASVESHFMQGPPVKGCGGIIRSPTFTPRSGQVQYHKKTRQSAYHHRSARTVVQKLVNKAGICKAPLITVPTPSRASLHKGNRRGVTSGDNTTNRYSYYATPSRPAINTRSNRVLNMKERQDRGEVGLVIRCALRICFCQPYDGAGKPTRAVMTNCSYMKSQNTRLKYKSALSKDFRMCDREDKTDLPIARVVHKEGQEMIDSRGSKKNKPGKKMRK